MIPSEARGAWQDIERRLRPFVARRVASPGDVDDVLQDILVRMHRSLAGLRDGESFGGWAYRVARSAIADAARTRARAVLELVDETPELEAQGDEHDDLASELGACVAVFVARLPAAYRDAVTLTELQGLTQKDAADMLGVSLPAMKSRILRGRERLRDMFEECCRISVDCRGRVLECEPRALEEVPAGCRDAAAACDRRGRPLRPVTSLPSSRSCQAPAHRQPGRSGPLLPQPRGASCVLAPNLTPPRRQVVPGLSAYCQFPQSTPTMGPRLLLPVSPSAPNGIYSPGHAGQADVDVSSAVTV